MGRPLLRLSLVSLAICARAQVVAAGPACIAIPDGAPAPVVTACDDGEHYLYTIAGTAYEYDRTAYRAALETQLRDWLRSVGESAEGEELAIEIWLAVPDANPAATAARFVVRAGTGKSAPRFVVFASLHPADWSFTNRDVGVLTGAAGYPGDFGVRVGELLVKAAPGAAKSEVDGFLAGYGLGAPDAFGQGWRVYALTAFAERSARTGILSDPQGAALVEKIDYNHVVEWIAHRSRAFAFIAERSEP